MIQLTKMKSEYNCFKKSFMQIPALCAVILSFVLLTGCSGYESLPHTETGFYFDTVIQISIYDSISEKEAARIIGKCFDMMSCYEKLYSRTMEGSDIYNINHSAGQSVSVDPETIALIKTAMDYAKISDRTVDPTVGNLSVLWNIGASGTETVPSKKDISDALSTVDYHNIEISGQNITLKNNSAIDLGFIAKGYAADRIKEYLQEENISSAIINLGGNILLLGDKGGNDFNIGLKNPKAPEGDPITTLKVSDCSIVSSGDYERYFEYDGVRYHHILSLSDGYPAQSDLSMVTIISQSSTEADALSTICYILGKEKATEFLNKNYPDVYAIFTDKDNNLYYSR